MKKEISPSLKRGYLEIFYLAFRKKDLKIQNKAELIEECYYEVLKLENSS